MGRLRGPRLSLGLRGLHLSGPRYYFGRRRRRRVTVTWSEPPRAPLVAQVPSWWARVDRVELHSTDAGSLIRMWHEGLVDDLAYDVPVGRLSAVIRPWLAGFAPDGQAMVRR